MLNELLQKQVSEHFGQEIPVHLEPLFNKISNTYNRFEQNASEKNSNDYKSAAAEEMTHEDITKQFATHLNVSQKTALIGSYEADLTGEGHDNVYWSDQVFTILGYQPREIEASFRLFFHAIHEDDRLWIMGKLDNLIKMGGSFEIEHRLVTIDGIVKTVLNTVEVFFNCSTKAPVKMIGTVQDITEKRKKDRDLINLNYELKTLFENMQEAFWSVDMRTYTTLQISQACEEIYGYSVEEFMKDSLLWLKLILEEDKHIVESNYPAVSAGIPFNQQYRILHKNGKVKWVESRINPTMEDGKVVRLDGVTSDITERKLSEMALQEEELKFRTLIENCSDGIAVLNQDLELSYVSNSMSRLSGFSRDEMMGRHIFALLHPDEIEWASGIAQNLMENPGTPFPLQGRFLKNDGSYFFYEGYITNLMNEPVIGGIICNFHDVTERQNAEEAVKASNIELTKINKELDRFVYSVSHDLRAPLASILGALEYAETETEDPMMLKNLSLMKGSAQKLDGFIVDILNYSRNSRLEVKKEEIDFAELLNDVKNNLKYMGSRDAQIDICVHIENNLPFYSDRSRLSIIINNLVSNSIRYYNPAAAAPLVHVSVTTSSEEALIVVKDNGVGIDEKFHDKIFNMFYRLSKKSQGSGLGLYIVKETVDKLQGSLHLESTPGEGTEFTLCIPNTK